MNCTVCDGKGKIGGFLGFFATECLQCGGTGTAENYNKINQLYLLSNEEIVTQLVRDQDIKFLNYCILQSSNEANKRLLQKIIDGKKIRDIPSNNDLYHGNILKGEFISKETLTQSYRIKFESHLQLFKEIEKGDKSIEVLKSIIDDEYDHSFFAYCIDNCKNEEFRRLYIYRKSKGEMSCLKCGTKKDVFTFGYYGGKLSDHRSNPYICGDCYREMLGTTGMERNKYNIPIDFESVEQLEIWCIEDSQEHLFSAPNYNIKNCTFNTKYRTENRRISQVINDFDIAFKNLLNQDTKNLKKMYKQWKISKSFMVSALKGFAKLGDQEGQWWIIQVLDNAITYLHNCNQEYDHSNLHKDIEKFKEHLLSAQVALEIVLPSIPTMSNEVLEKQALALAKISDNDIEKLHIPSKKYEIPKRYSAIVEEALIVFGDPDKLMYEKKHKQFKIKPPLF